MKGKIVKVLLTISLGVCLSFAVAACGSTGGVAEEGGTADRVGSVSESGKMLTLKSGEPQDFLGREGDVCLVAETGILYRKGADGWQKAEFESYGAEDDVFTVNYSNGTVGTYEMSAQADASDCKHTDRTEPYTVFAPQCIIPGIGVEYCKDCGQAFSVVLPALSDGHQYTVENICSICGDELEYTTEGLNYTWRGYGAERTYYVRESPSASGDIVIPYGIYDNYTKSWCPVTEIGIWAFEDNLNITGVTIPDTIKTIGISAFDGCKNLKGNLVLPSALETLSDNAFTGCSGLTGITFRGTSLKEIGAYAFMDCTGLTGKLRLPESLEAIDVLAFDGCSGLTGELVLPAGLTFLGTSAFCDCAGLTGTVRIPDGVKDLGCGSDPSYPGGSVFENCVGITGVEFGPDSQLERIRYDDFRGCVNLTGDLKLPRSLQTIDPQAFRGTAITGLSFENGSALNLINTKAFYGCLSLEKLILPEGLTEIGESAFRKCPMLAGDNGLLTIPDSLTKIGSYAFALYKDYNDPEEYEEGEFWALDAEEEEGGYITAVKLGKEITEYPMSVFGGRTSIGGKITIPAKVQKLGSSLFRDMQITGVEFEEGSVLQSIGSETFANCAQLGGEIVFPDSLETIGSSAFDFINVGQMYSQITALTFTKNSHLKTIGTSAFRCCRFVKSIVIPQGVTSLGSSSFDGCYSLKEIWNYSAIEIIAGNYYENSKIGARAAIVYTEDVPSSFVDNGDGYLFLEGTEDSLLVGYQGTKTDLELPLASPEGKDYRIFDYAFYFDPSIENVVISTGVLGIERNAFQNCSALRSVTFTKEAFFGGKFTEINAYAFSACPLLETLMIPGSTKTNGNTIVSGDVSLKNVYTGFGIEDLLWNGKTNYMEWSGIEKLIGSWAWYSETDPTLDEEWEWVAEIFPEYPWWHYNEQGEIVMWDI